MINRYINDSIHINRDTVVYRIETFDEIIEYKGKKSKYKELINEVRNGDETRSCIATNKLMNILVEKGKMTIASKNAEADTVESENAEDETVSDINKELKVLNNPVKSYSRKELLTEVSDSNPYLKAIKNYDRNEEGNRMSESNSYLKDIKTLIKFGNSIKCRGCDTFAVKNKDGKLVDLADEIKYLSCMYAISYTKDSATFYSSLIEDELDRLRKGELDINEIKRKLPNFTEFSRKKDNLFAHISQSSGVINLYALLECSWDNVKNREGIITSALCVVYSYIGGLIDKLDPGITEENKIYEVLEKDEIGKLCTISLIYAIMQNTCDYKFDIDIQLIIQKYCKDMLNGTWEDVINAFESNRLKDIYLGYKQFFVDDDKYTDKDKDKEAFISDIFDNLLTSYGKLDKKELLGYDFRGFVRGLNDVYNDYGTNKNLWDLDKKDREITINLIHNTLDADYAYGMRKVLDYVSMALNLAYYDSEKLKLNEQRLKEVEKLKESHKLKIGMLKKELAKAKEQTAFHKDKNNKLVKELKNVDKESFNIMEETIKLLENEIKELKQALNDSDELNHELNTSIESLYDSIEEITSSRYELEHELINYRSTVFDTIEDTSSIAVSSRDIPVEVLYNSFKDKRILLLGGNKIHARLKEKQFNNIDCLDAGNVNFKITSAQKYDLVVIYTKLVSHSIVEKIESQMRNYNVPIIRFNEAGVNSLIHTIFMYLNSGDSIRTGEYRL